ncbi:MAG: uroporphyrinogen decarboxylase [Alicyclobacillus herbarius]|uniref:uroporphyrinogen decarboxylase n=1 Tax=Alicyclobacillus herbarius TaxID=122960 RepID=UPI002357E7A5|nr:uroporphyrinogen decarboxylase [Alicyclobacillus herbarius]MCL6630988.1 uroporphyrinogen decarboxylase [Alicyclobacillus herbarius]
MSRTDRFLKACRRQPVDVSPVWFMRQAGRYQPEYRQLRERYSLLEICRQPELCVQVTRLPVEQLGVDAAILFSDISLPIGAMGREFDIQEHVGPVLAHPVRSRQDVESLHRFDPEEALPYVFESIRGLKRELPVPLIGFAGAPFTLASYIIEGGPSRDYLRTKQMMWSEPSLWQDLMDTLADVTIRYLQSQIAAGVDAVQLFDSWVGSLSPDDYRVFVLPTMRRIMGALEPFDVPLIYFGVTTGELLPIWPETGATVIGVDWRVRLEDAATRVGPQVALQGNLDPALLFAPWEVIEARTKSILDQGLNHSGFIFNLGHGVHRLTDASKLQRLTEFVHSYSEQRLKEQGVRV